MLHLVGILFPRINDDARSKSHKKKGKNCLPLRAIETLLGYRGNYGRMKWHDMLQVWNLETERSEGARYEEEQMLPIRGEEQRVPFITEAPRNADGEQELQERERPHFERGNSSQEDVHCQNCQGKEKFECPRMQFQLDTLNNSYKMRCSCIKPWITDCLQNVHVLDLHFNSSRSYRVTFLPVFPFVFKSLDKIRIIIMRRVYCSSF